MIIVDHARVLLAIALQTEAVKVLQEERIRMRAAPGLLGSRPIPPTNEVRVTVVGLLHAPTRGVLAAPLLLGGRPIPFPMRKGCCAIVRCRSCRGNWASRAFVGTTPGLLPGAPAVILPAETSMTVIGCRGYLRNQWWQRRDRAARARMSTAPRLLPHAPAVQPIAKTDLAIVW